MEAYLSWFTFMEEDSNGVQHISKGQILSWTNRLYLLHLITDLVPSVKKIHCCFCPHSQVLNLKHFNLLFLLKMSPLPPSPTPGFLSTGDTVIQGNMGMKDQVAGLSWVKNNIERFGGNPELITIFGESAGGAAVSLQMLSPMSEGSTTTCETCILQS